MSSCGSTINNGGPLSIAVTPGEPAGIGPDLALLLGQMALPANPIWVVDPALLSAKAAQLALPCKISEFDGRRTARHEPGCFTVLPVRMRIASRSGILAVPNAPYVLECLDQAVAGCLEGSFDAMVTGPIHKGVINDAGIPFTGHTEYLARLAGNCHPVMMLAAGTLRVALVTTHVALRDVPALITADAVRYVVETVDAGLRRDFDLPRPRLLVCGLNPHAGESGHLGREEIEVIAPVLDACRARGHTLAGPLPADTAFTPEALAKADAVVAMYHDQGLTALKALGFGSAVNLTLGLPFIRTSVDHGTALELAGTGAAHVSSLKAAFDLAVGMAQQRKRLA